MNVILYHTGCPKCQVLEKKLNMEEISYTEVTDVNVMSEKGFMSVPILEVDGKIMNFTKAIEWLNDL